MIKGIFLLSVSLLFASCSFEPRCYLPSLELPQSWRVETNDSSTICNLRWWEALNDPILDALILVGLENNKDLKVAAWRVCEFYGQFQVQRSPLYPQIDLQASAVKKRFPESSSFLPPGFDPITPQYGYAFNLSYELDFWGKFRNAARSAFANWAASVEDRRVVVLTLVSAIATAYVQMRELDKELEISLKTLEARRESLIIATLRFEGGITSEIQVTQSAALYEETQAEIARLLELIPQKENLISILLGKNPTCILRGETIDQFILPPCIPAGLPSDLLTRRPDILQAEQELISANALVGVARANFFPQFSLTGLFGGESFELKQLFSKSARAWELGGRLFQSIFTGGQLSGELNSANARKMEALYNYEQVILNALKEVNDALIAHKQTREIVEIETRRVKDIQLYLSLAWEKYYEGQTEYLTVLDAQRELFRTEISLAKAQGEVFTTLIDLYKALGGGWVLDADSCLRH